MTSDQAEAIRRRNVDSYGLDPRRAADLLAFMRERGLTQWPPPAPTVEQRRAHWQASVARWGLGPARWETAWGSITPWTVSEFHPDPARRMVFYLGVGHPHHLNDAPVPLFLSATTLARYRRRGEQFLAGFLPAVGQTVVPVLGALVGGWFLAVELVGVPFTRRGLRLPDRRRALRAHRPAALGFGTAVFCCFLVPGGAVLVMPAAVAGGTLLARRALGLPDPAQR